MGKLTDAKIRAAKPADRDQWIGDGDGLWLRVRAGGAKVFVLRLKRQGTTHIITLGHWPSYTLREARLEAARRGARPRERIAAQTVSDVADEWMRDVINKTYRRPHHVQGYLDRALLPALGRVKVRDLVREDVANLVKRYAKRGPVAANRLLAIIRQVLGYAVEAGYIPENPAEGVTRRIAGGTESARERVLSDDEIRLIWRADTDHGPLLRFLLLTGQRIGEAQRAEWAHIHGDRWNIPVEHSKNGRPHWVHLSPAALGVLRELPNDGARVFRAVSLTATQAWLRRWCAREQIEPAFTPHDLRRTFATRLNDLGCLPHIVEKCLNHTMQGVMAVYNRAEYEGGRIDAWNLWGAALTRIVEPDSVIRLGR